jgi:hypothetical protein
VEQCENIGPRQRRRRVVIGTLVLAAALLLALGLLHFEVARSWRLSVFVPLFLGSIGLLQVPARTCVKLAAKGVRDMDDGEKPVTDEWERQRLSAQARRVLLQALGVAVALTAALWLL